MTTSLLLGLSGQPFQLRVLSVFQFTTPSLLNATSLRFASAHFIGRALLGEPPCPTKLSRGTPLISASPSLVSRVSPIIMKTTRKVPIIRKSLKPARPLHRLSDERDSTICVDCLPPLLHQNEVSWNEENWTISRGYAQWETKWSNSPSFRRKHYLKGQERSIERRHSGQGDGTKKDAERITYSREFLMKIATLPISKEKPEFLPSLPVVLERPPTSVTFQITPS
ncbi:uncharacterized protein C8orf88 homolog isoform X3 [Narcine bancroftii]|uniref:uncharacterized protein C8orf88 homolog isoform X3 n=1 Tax=Narcine bancroftii TaxID=1343680 RepID=UPI003831EF6E